jgi:hypothetical protein
LHEQARVLDAEVLLVDGSDEGVPQEAQRQYPQVTFVHVPGANSFQLRAVGMTRARGEIVGVTEDHCRVAQDWCQAVLEAHRQWPEAAVIGGETHNGADQTFVDWAYFYYAHGPDMPPAQAGPTTSPSLQANTSYKRRVVPSEFPETGCMAWMLNRDLLARGEKFLRDTRMRVWHVQPMSFGEICSLQFHDGRTVSGFRRREIGIAERGLRVAVALSLMTPLLVLRTAQWMFWKAPGRFLSAVPAITIFAACRSLGSALGLAFGEGRSAWKLD